MQIKISKTWLKSGPKKKMRHEKMETKDWIWIFLTRF